VLYRLSSNVNLRSHCRLIFRSAPDFHPFAPSSSLPARNLKSLGPTWREKKKLYCFITSSRDQNPKPLTFPLPNPKSTRATSTHPGDSTASMRAAGPLPRFRGGGRLPHIRAACYVPGVHAGGGLSASPRHRKLGSTMQVAVSTPPHLGFRGRMPLEPYLWTWGTAVHTLSLGSGFLAVEISRCKALVWFSEYMHKEDFLGSWGILAVNCAGTISKNNKTRKILIRWPIQISGE